MGTLAKSVLVIAGIAAYILSIKFIKNQFPRFTLQFPELLLKQSIYYAYFFAAFAAIIAGLFFIPDRISASKEGLLEMAASLPLLFIKFRNENEIQQISGKTHWLFYFLACAAYTIFCLTLGKGIY